MCVRFIASAEECISERECKLYDEGLKILQIETIVLQSYGSE